MMKETTTLFGLKRVRCTECIDAWRDGSAEREHSLSRVNPFIPTVPYSGRINGLVCSF